MLNSAFARFAVYLVVLFFAAQIDAKIFGVGDALRLRSHLIAARVLGAEYPNVDLTCTREAVHCVESVRDASAVVLIDDPSIQGMRAGWPAPYSVHARILSEILRQKPKAVFVDILFVDQRADMSIRKLQQVIQDYRQARVPLVFAAPPSSMNEVLLPEIEAALGEELIGSMASVVLASNRPQVGGGTSLALSSTEQDNSTDSEPPDFGFGLASLQEYASGLAYPEPAVGDGCQIFPAAHVMADIFLKGDYAQEPPPLKTRCEKSGNGEHGGFVPVHQAIAADRPGNFRELKWNARPGSGTGNIWRCGEALHSTGFDTLDQVRRTIEALWSFDDARERCPPIATVRALQLVALRGQAIEADGACRDPIEACLRNRVVFYGADITAASDLVETPISGRIPGVYVHAMAFDNILTFSDLNMITGPLSRSEVQNMMDHIATICFLFISILASSYVLDRVDFQRYFNTSSKIWKVRVEVVILICALLGSVVWSSIVALMLMGIMKTTYLDFGLPPFNFVSIQILVGSTVLFDILRVRDVCLKPESVADR